MNDCDWWASRALTRDEVIAEYRQAIADDAELSNDARLLTDAELGSLKFTDRDAADASVPAKSFLAELQLQERRRMPGSFLFASTEG